jgi:hypothetical protein
MHSGNRHVHHSALDALNWPVIGLNITVWAWFRDLWDHFPGPTAVYMTVSAAFMLFQMADKLGMLDRFKRRKAEGAEDAR